MATLLNDSFPSADIAFSASVLLNLLGGYSRTLGHRGILFLDQAAEPRRC
jgi:hypothetical protein